jgi:hypothetical protein
VDAPDPGFVAASRRRDLLLTLVMMGILLTPAWLTPPWFSRPWEVAAVLLGAPAVFLTWHHAPWVPTPKAELPRIVRALALQPTERFCDLGAGDGRLLVWVQAATGAACTGIEAAPLLALLARLRIALSGGGARIRFGDLYAADLSEFDAVYVWGTAYSVGTERFRAFLQRSARPGTRLVSYHTPIPGLVPTAVDEGGQRQLFTYVLG